MIEDIPTTYRCDFTAFKTELAETIKPKRRNYSITAPLDDEDGLEDYKILRGRQKSSHTIHFETWGKKPIVGTDPREKFVIHEIPKDDIDYLRRTRPRPVMTPQISIDEAAILLRNDPKFIDLIIKDTYTTEWEKAAETVSLYCEEKEEFNTTMEEDPVPVPRYNPKPPADNIPSDPYWERLRNMMLANSTLKFWRKHGLNMKSPQEVTESSTISEDKKKEIACLIKQDMLRLPFDKTIPGYAGFIPKNPISINLKKAKMHSNDPRMSLTQISHQ